MALKHFDIENYEASVTRYIATAFNGYSCLLDESPEDFDAMTKWFFMEFLGNSGETTTEHPVNNLMLHIRTRGESAAADMTTLTRLAIDAIKDKVFDLYNVETGVVIGKLRSVILREFPRETARQARSARGFNRSLLIQITYGKVGVAYV